MSTFFMGRTSHAVAEALMRQPPGYAQRGGGRRWPELTYTAADLRCELCLHWQQGRCVLKRCICLKERLAAGLVAYDDLLRELVTRNSSPACARRIQALAGTWTGSLFSGSAHRVAFAIGKMSWQYKKPKQKELAALFLLTASQEMRDRSWAALKKDAIDFAAFPLREISGQGYALYQAAKTVVGSGHGLSHADLSDRELVDDDTFRLIVHAMLLARFGAAVMGLEKEAANGTD